MQLLNEHMDRVSGIQAKAVPLTPLEQWRASRAGAS
jgi:hypothetical protein